jgi:hypothetical protein
MPTWCWPTADGKGLRVECAHCGMLVVDFKLKSQGHKKKPLTQCDIEVSPAKSAAGAIDRSWPNCGWGGPSWLCPNDDLEA